MVLITTALGYVLGAKGDMNYALLAIEEAGRELDYSTVTDKEIGFLASFIECWVAVHSDQVIDIRSLLIWPSLYPHTPPSFLIAMLCLMSR